MNEKKSSPIAAIKGILGSNRLLFICIVYTVAALGNVIKAFRDRIDFEGMQFFGISLIDVTMYPGVACLESYAFAYCPDLMYIYIPESVGLIESETFYESHNITTVRYGGTEEGWQKFIRQDIDDYSWYEINSELRNAYVIYGVTLEQDPPSLPVPETTT